MEAIQSAALSQALCRRAAFKHEKLTQKGYDFEPRHIENRDLDISTIASQAAEPVDLFRQLSPEKIVEKQA